MIGICLLFLYIKGLAKWAFPSSDVKIVLCIFLRFLKGRGRMDSIRRSYEQGILPC